MAQYALLDGENVIQVLVADNEASLGVMGQIYETVDVTHTVPQPSRGWKLKAGVWTPPGILPNREHLWNGINFDDDNIIDAEEIEPTKALTDGKKDKK
jgi:hypothetical protein